MKKLNIYTFGLVMLSAILNAKKNDPVEITLLYDILDQVNNCITQQLQGTVPEVRGKSPCRPHFFCQAEKSLNMTTDNRADSLKNNLHKYNIKTGQVKCNKNYNKQITINDLLLDLRNCTLAAIGNRSRGTRHVVGLTPF